MELRGRTKLNHSLVYGRNGATLRVVALATGGAGRGRAVPSG